MYNNMDTEDIKNLIIMKDEGYILRNNKVLDTGLQGQFSIKNELLYTTDNCNKARSIETGTQIDTQMLNSPVKKEPRSDVHVKLQPSVDNLHRSIQKLPVKQEITDTIGNSIISKDFNSHFIPEPNISRNLLPEHEAKPFTPYCDIISVKQEVNDIICENIDIKNESIDINNDGEMIQMENGCTNSGCSSQTRCLHTYRCSKCNLVFTEKQIFATHLQKCRLNQNSSTVPSTKTTSTPRKTYECEHDNHILKKLIDSVRTNPPLYDLNNEDYNDIQLKEVIWANIACSCGFSNGVLAKEAWKKLKENFRDALAQQNNTLGHQTVLIHGRPFKYQKHMEFLLPYMSNNISAQDIPVETLTIPDMNSVEETEADISIIQQLVSPAKKQKVLPPAIEPLNTSTNTNKRNRDGRKKICNNLKEPNVRSNTSTQPLHMFFLSMCETTKNLPPHLQLQVKRRVFQAVIEAEETAATLNNDSTNNNNTPRISSSSREDPYTVAQFSLDSLTNVIDNSSSSSQED